MSDMTIYPFILFLGMNMILPMQNFAINCIKNKRLVDCNQDFLICGKIIMKEHN